MLKLKGITSLEKANEYLQGEFIGKLNDKFAKAPADVRDAHAPLTQEDDLDAIFCWEEERQVKNDWTIQYKNQHYQLEKRQPVEINAKQKILVRKHLDNQISLWREDKRLNFYAIESRAEKPTMQKKAYTSADRSMNARKNKHKSPWSIYKGPSAKSQTKYAPQAAAL